MQDKQKDDKVNETLQFLQKQQAEPMPPKIDFEEFMQNDLL